jgi:hypothetical protein
MHTMWDCSFTDSLKLDDRWAEVAEAVFTQMLGRWRSFSLSRAAVGKV